jgi:hypothetical protein
MTTTNSTRKSVESAIANSHDSAMAAMFARNFAARGMRVAVAALQAHSDGLMALELGDVDGAARASAIREDELNSLTV